MKKAPCLIAGRQNARYHLVSRGISEISALPPPFFAVTGCPAESTGSRLSLGAFPGGCDGLFFLLLESDLQKGTVKALSAAALLSLRRPCSLLLFLIAILVYHAVRVLSREILKKRRSGVFRVCWKIRQGIFDGKMPAECSACFLMG